MIDTYLASSDQTALRSFCGFFVNVIGPDQGREGAGDPAKWYACIRAPLAIAAQEGIDVVTQDEGSAVIGVWA